MYSNIYKLWVAIFVHPLCTDSCPAVWALDVKYLWVGKAVLTSTESITSFLNATDMGTEGSSRFINIMLML